MNNLSVISHLLQLRRKFVLELAIHRGVSNEEADQELSQIFATSKIVFPYLFFPVGSEGRVLYLLSDLFNIKIERVNPDGYNEFFKSEVTFYVGDDYEKKIVEFFFEIFWTFFPDIKIFIYKMNGFYSELKDDSICYFVGGKPFDDQGMSSKYKTFSFFEFKRRSEKLNLDSINFRSISIDPQKNSLTYYFNDAEKNEVYILSTFEQYDYSKDPNYNPNRDINGVFVSIFGEKIRW